MVTEADTIIRTALDSGHTNLLEPDAKSLCKTYGMMVPPFGVARDAEEASKLAEAIGYPIVLKVVSYDILHKTDAGGVLLDLKTPAEVVKGFSTIVEHTKKIKPESIVDKILVEKMMPNGIEVIVGGFLDPQFGQTLMFGLGGVLVEVLKDVVLRVCPIAERDAKDMLHEVRGRTLLNGYRGQPPADEKALTEVLLQASKLMMDHPEIEQMDLNPVIAYEKGACVIDARIILKKGLT
jgi:acyl-CoA synthetase (NDP forming)